MSSILDGVKLYGSATVGTKGQIVIPAEAREEFNIKEGDKVVIFNSMGKEGFMIIKAEALEETLRKLQFGLGEMLKTSNDKKAGE